MDNMEYYTTSSTNGFRLENLLNEQALAGWTLVSCMWIEREGFYTVVMTRKRRKKKKK